MEPLLPSEKLASVRKYRDQNLRRSLFDRNRCLGDIAPTVTQLMISSECNHFGVKSVKQKFAYRLRMSLSELFPQSAICFLFLLSQASVFSSSFANATAPTSSWEVSGTYIQIITVISKIYTVTLSKWDIFYTLKICYRTRGQDLIFTQFLLIGTPLVSGGKIGDNSLFRTKNKGRNSGFFWLHCGYFR